MTQSIFPAEWTLLAPDYDDASDSRDDADPAMTDRQPGSTQRSVTTVGLLGNDVPMDPFAQGDLNYRVYEDAVVVPSASRTVYRDIYGGAFDANLRPIERSFLTRTWNPPQISFPPETEGFDPERIETVEEPHIYGGYFFDHFGHFLLESLARAWVVEEVGRLPFVWASGGPSNGWQGEILSLLGLHVPMRFPKRPIRFRRLIVPEPGFRIQGIFHRRHARFLSCFSSDREGGESGKVWLSRTEIRPEGRCPGERQLQQQLAAEGWEIVHPQRLSVVEQLRILSNASVVAGLEGSAFHAAVLLDGHAAPFVTLRRTRSRNYRVIADCKGIVEFDLYGAFRILARRDRRLIHPRETARTLEELARQVERCRDDTVALARLRDRVEVEHSFERWETQQRRRRISHARAFLAEQKLGRRLRLVLKRVSGA